MARLLSSARDVSSGCSLMEPSWSRTPRSAERCVRCRATVKSTSSAAALPGFKFCVCCFQACDRKQVTELLRASGSSTVKKMRGGGQKHIYIFVLVYLLSEVITIKQLHHSLGPINISIDGKPVLLLSLWFPSFI